MSNGRLRLELSDAGSRFRVGDMKGRIRASTGKSTFKMVTVSLIWSVRMVHSVAASGPRRVQSTLMRWPYVFLGERPRTVHWSRG